MEIDWGLDRKIVDAHESVFDWMLTTEGYTRDLGSLVLRQHYGTDWSEAWENWWDGGED